MTARSNIPVGKLVAVICLGITGLTAAILGVSVGDLRFGNLPASPGGLLAIVAAALLASAAAILWADAGRRMDSSYASKPSSLFAVGALTNGELKLQLRASLKLQLAYLPTRVSLIASSTGVELWGRPGETKYVVIPWGDIEIVSTGMVLGFGRPFRALSFKLIGRDETVSVPLAGGGLSGSSFPKDSEAREFAAELNALRLRFMER